MRTPVQQRARRSVDAIIEAAALVLDDKGLPGFNTKAVAARAGVNVATLYQYFENKQAVMRELLRRVEVRRTEMLAECLEQYRSTGDGWEPLVTAALDGLVTWRVSEPGAAALRRALAASPELQSLHTASLDRDALAIQHALLGRGVADPDRAMALGVLFAHIADATLEVAVQGERVDYRLVDELRATMVHHLDAVLAEQRSGAGAQRRG